MAYSRAWDNDPLPIPASTTTDPGRIPERPIIVAMSGVNRIYVRRFSDSVCSVG